MIGIHPPSSLNMREGDVAGFCYKTIVLVVHISVQTIIKLHINTTQLNKLINQTKTHQYTRTAMNAVASFRFIFFFLFPQKVTIGVQCIRGTIHLNSSDSFTVSSGFRFLYFSSLCGPKAKKKKKKKRPCLVANLLPQNSFLDYASSLYRNILRYSINPLRLFSYFSQNLHDYVRKRQRILSC